MDDDLSAARLLAEGKDYREIAEILGLPSGMAARDAVLAALTAAWPEAGEAHDRTVDDMRLLGFGNAPGPSLLASVTPADLNRRLLELRAELLAEGIDPDADI